MTHIRRGGWPAPRSTVLALCALLASASPSLGQDRGLALDLPGAIDLALEQNFGIRRMRNSLASSQSSLIVSENRFDFQVRTTLRDSRDYRRNRSVFLPSGDVERDLLDDGQSLDVAVIKDMHWGGSFTLDAGWDRNRNDYGSPELGHWARYGLSYRQPLWGGRGRKVATRSLVGSRQAYLDQTRSLTEAELALVVNVISSYHDVLRREALIEISRKAAERSGERHELAKLRLAEGLITPIDVKRTERQKFDRENDVIAAVEAHEAALDDFAFQLGLPIGTLRTLAPVRETFERLEIDVDTAVSEALENRFDLASEREALALSKLDVDIARSNMKPNLDLTLQASFGTETGEEAKEWFDVTNEDDWGSTLSLSYTFNDKSDDESYLRSRISLENRKISLIESERRVELDVRRAIRSIRSLERRIEILEQNKALTEEALALAELQFEEDLISTTDLLNDQDEVVDAERRYVEAIADHAIARANLDLTLGRYHEIAEPRRSEFLRESPAPPELPLIPRRAEDAP